MCAARVCGVHGGHYSAARILVVTECCGGGAGKAVWKLDDPEALKAEVAAREEEKRAALRKKAEQQLTKKLVRACLLPPLALSWFPELPAVCGLLLLLLCPSYLRGTQPPAATSNVPRHVESALEREFSLACRQTSRMHA
jgi:hypothetical protein